MATRHSQQQFIANFYSHLLGVSLSHSDEIEALRDNRLVVQRFEARAEFLYTTGFSSSYKKAAHDAVTGIVGCLHLCHKLIAKEKNKQIRRLTRELEDTRSRLSAESKNNQNTIRALENKILVLDDESMNDQKTIDNAHDASIAILAVFSVSWFSFLLGCVASLPIFRHCPWMDTIADSPIFMMPFLLWLAMGYCVFVSGLLKKFPFQVTILMLLPLIPCLLAGAILVSCYPGAQYPRLPGGEEINYET